jgi:hypothetical protein
MVKIIVLFNVPFESISYPYRDIITDSEGLHNLRLRSALTAFEQEEIFIMQHLL